MNDLPMSSVEQRARELLARFGETDPRSGERAIGHSGPENGEWETYIEVSVETLARIAAALRQQEQLAEPLREQPEAFTQADMERFGKLVADARERRLKSQQPEARGMVERVTSAVVTWATLPGDLPAAPEDVAELRDVIAAAVAGQP